MARRYIAQGSQAAALTDTILTVVSNTTVRPHVYEVLFGSAATPADQAFLINCQRFAAGAGTAGSAADITKMDGADPATQCTAGQAHSVEPTYVASDIPLKFAINQQATFRWVVLPAYGIILTNSASAGLGGVPLVVSGGTPTLQLQFAWEE